MYTPRKYDYVKYIYFKNRHVFFNIGCSPSPYSIVFKQVCTSFITMTEAIENGELKKLVHSTCTLIKVIIFMNTTTAPHQKAGFYQTKTVCIDSPRSQRVWNQNIKTFQDLGQHKTNAQNLVRFYTN